MPWMMIRHLNEILDTSDKEGGRVVDESSNTTLANIVFPYGLMDLGFIGCPFTRNNRRPPPFNVQECLDTVLTMRDLTIVVLSA